MCTRRKISSVSDTKDDSRLDREGQVEQERDWSRFRQHLAALTANLATLSGGAAYGWTSPALPLLQSKDHEEGLPLLVNPDEGSWIGSLLPLGALFGALPAGFLATTLGRKKAILSLTLPYIVGWLCIIFAADNLSLVYVGRFINGFALGATTVLVSQYCEEIAEDSIRGALGVYLDLNLCNGYLLVNTFGSFLSYMGITVASSTLPVIFFATFYWMPESPVYLVMKGRLEEAQKSLLWLRKGKKSYDVQEELRYLKECLSVDAGDQDGTITSIIKDLFKNGISGSITTLKPILVVYVLVFFQQTQGIDSIIFYSVIIFRDAEVKLPSNVSSIILSVSQSAADVLSSLIVDRVGRKPMLLLSSAMTAVAQATLSIFFHFKHHHHHDMREWNWVPLMALTVFVMGYTIGFSPLPWLIMNELVPTKMKGWVNSGAVCMNWSLVFLVSKEFLEMSIRLGKDVTYGIFCIMCVSSFVFVLLCLPETKGKSRKEIQEALRGNKM